MKTNLQEAEHAEKAPRDIGAAARHVLEVQKHKSPGFKMIATTQQNMTTDLVRLDGVYIYFLPPLFHALKNSGLCMCMCIFLNYYYS